MNKNIRKTGAMKGCCKKWKKGASLIDSDGLSHDLELKVCLGCGEKLEEDNFIKPKKI